MKTIGRRAFEILAPAESGDAASRWFDIGLLTLIVLNVLAVILATVPEAASSCASFFRIFEVISVAIFTVEYVLRVWSCTESDDFAAPVVGRLRYVRTPLALVDLAAILPFYLPAILPLDLRFLRAVRLFRIFRIFKMGRYSESLRTVCAVLAAKKEQLLMSVFVVFVMLIVASSLMYFVEHEAQPEAFSSIPAAMWWGVSTLTTVGYGDVYPVTGLGKLIGAIVAILGIGLFALPAGILASGFAERMEKPKRRKCPYCGRDLD